MEAEIFRNLAKALMENTTTVIPTPVADLSDLEVYTGSTSEGRRRPDLP